MSMTTETEISFHPTFCINMSQYTLEITALYSLCGLILKTAMGNHLEIINTNGNHFYSEKYRSFKFNKEDLILPLLDLRSL